MRLFPKINFSIPRRLLLLTAIPILGLVVLGGMTLRTYHSEYNALVGDAKSLSAYQRDLADFIAFANVLAAERNAALQLFVHRDDPKTLAGYQALFPATDRAVAGLMAKLERLVASPQGAAFADKNEWNHTFFATQLPEARTNAVQNKRTSGEVFTIYFKLMYQALVISEGYRKTVQTPDGLNIYDAIQGMQKIQQQEALAVNLMTHGLQNGGLQRDELAIVRRQVVGMAEGEYYMLRVHPMLRAHFKATTRNTEDETAFYQYLIDLVATQQERVPIKAFVPKTQTLAELVQNRPQVYESLYRYCFNYGQETLLGIARHRQRRAFLVGGFLIAGIGLSLGLSLALTRGTRRDLVHVSANIAQASDDVQSASTQLTAAGEQMSRDANHYASAIEKINVSIGLVSTVVETNKSHAATAAATSTRARDSVDAGLGTIQELDRAMNSARISGQKINQVIARINELSFQTNLLALNAAVEAARAGEAGAGFAVVADEVRQLAGRCADAAKETAELIGESAKDTATAITKSDELATRFKSVSHGIHEVNETVTLISSNFTQQAASINEISHSISKQREIAQSMAAAAQETASTAFSMENQVGSLRTSVQRMDHLLGAGRSSKAVPPSREAQPRPKAKKTSAEKPTAARRNPTPRTDRRWNDPVGVKTQRTGAA